MDGKPANPLRQHILEAVDCLRQRKCRPDRESIAHYVLRKFGSTMNEIFAELENIVDEGGLIKVEYKGTTSYRSPSSFDTKNSPLLTKHSKILNSSKTTRFIITGINELLVKDPNYTKEGVPLDELKETLVGFDSLRFADDKLDVLLERETNCGSIFIAKSDFLKDTLRVFPKDIPVPKDMRIISLSADATVVEKEEKKPRKPRKSNTDVTTAVAGTSGVKRGRKMKIKKEAEEEAEVGEETQEINDMNDSIFAVKSEPPPPDEETSESFEDSSPKKNSRLTPMGRKLVAEKVAEAVRKTYENTSEFETTSAQMIKLAEAVVHKQADEASQQKGAIGPVLVLAESIVIPNDNGDSPHSEKKESDQIIKTPNSTAVAGKKRGRPSSNKNKEKVDQEKNSETNKHKEDEKTQIVETSPSDQGLTRSKRDKRKKQVFDPSDLPKSYTTYSRASKVTNRNSRLDRSSSPEEPPAKKAVVSTNKRGRKSNAVIAESKQTSTRDSKKSNENTISIKPAGLNSPSAVDTKLDHANEDKNITTNLNEEESGEENGDVKEEIVSTKTEVRSDSSVNESCEYCLQNSKPTSTGENEEFLTCTSCNANIHPSCMDYSLELTNRIKQFSKMDAERKILAWQCFDCKTCKICQERIMPGSAHTSLKNGSSITVPNERTKKTYSSKTEKEQKSKTLEVVLCEHCDAGFHSKCIGEQFTKYSSGKNTWMCQECKDIVSVNKSPSTIPTSKTIDVESKVVPARKRGRPPRNQSKMNCESQATEISAASDSKDININTSICPAAVEVPSSESTDSNVSTSDSKDQTLLDIRQITEWTPSDVEAYFIEKGLKDEAAILREQDVDGYSLLLLQREDIVNGMGFRLGPALKVNRLIYQLQAKAPVRAKWNNDKEGKTDNSDITTTSVSQ